MPVCAGPERRLAVKMEEKKGRKNVCVYVYVFISTASRAQELKQV